MKPLIFVVMNRITRHSFFSFMRLLTPLTSLLLVTLVACTPQSNRVQELDIAILPAAQMPGDPYKFELNLKALRSAKPVPVADDCIAIDKRIDLGNPITIKSPGKYCLTNHIFADVLNRGGVVIAADDVILDLNGRTVVSIFPETTGFGVRSDGRNNVVVKNGNVHNFLGGVYFRNVGKASVRSVDASGNFWRGVFVDGQEAIVTDSNVRSMPGYEPWAKSPPIAFDIKAPVCDVSGNSFAHIRSEMSNKFINNVSKADECLFDNNTMLQSDTTESSCFSITQPMSITFGGDFCLENDIFVDTSESPGLDIRASNVNIDLGGYTIYGPGALSQAPGISINGGTNINVINGTVRAFESGINVERAQNVTLKNIQNAYHNRSGMILNGNKISVDNVVVRSIVGVEKKNTHPIYGIQLDGLDIRISNSEIMDVSSSDGGQSSAIDNTNVDKPFTFTGNRVANVQYLLSNSLGNDLVTDNILSIACGTSPQQKSKSLTSGSNSVSITGACLK